MAGTWRCCWTPRATGTRDEPAHAPHLTFWAAPDGHRYRVVLTPAPRHRMRQGDGRPVLTFMDLESTEQTHRMVPEGTVLEEMGEGELVGLLGRTS